MNMKDYGFVQTLESKGQAMLENTQWVRVNNQCHSLIDTDGRVLAVIFTSYDEDDGDENLIWEVEIEGDEMGQYISLYQAKLAVQQAIRDWEKKQEEANQKKTVRKSTKKKVIATKK